MALALNNIVMNSLDNLVKSGIKHFVNINLHDEINVNKFFSDCEKYLNETQQHGTVEWNGDNVITGRDTILGATFMTENSQYCDTLLIHYNDLMTWAMSYNVGVNLEDDSEAEFFAVIYHAYAMSRTDMLIEIYQDVKSEFLNRTM